MKGYYGEYEVTLDSKGRFLLPSGVRKQLPGEEQHFILSRGFERCLTLYCSDSWEKIIDKLSKLNDFDPKVRQFRRQFLGGATEISLDAAGRMLIPSNLRDFAGLSKNMVIAAALDRFEIWNAETYNKFFDNFSAEEFSDLAKEVMTGNESE